MDAMVPGSASAIRLPATALPPGKSFPSRCPRPTAIKINGKPLTLQRCRRWPLFWFLDLLDLFVRLHWADLGATSLMGHGRDVLSEAFEFRLLTRGIETNKTGWLFSHCDYCGNLSQTPVRMSDPVTCTAWKLATEFKQPCRHSNICQNHTNYIYIHMMITYYKWLYIYTHVQSLWYIQKKPSLTKTS